MSAELTPGLVLALVGKSGRVPTEDRFSRNPRTIGYVDGPVVAQTANNSAWDIFDVWLRGPFESTKDELLQQHVSNLRRLGMVKVVYDCLSPRRVTLVLTDYGREVLAESQEDVHLALLVDRDV